MVNQDEELRFLEKNLSGRIILMRYKLEAHKIFEINEEISGRTIASF